MSNYILKYSRDDRVKYISHLDFMRLFHRAVRRSGLPFVFSQGFNPHPIMTVAQPLSVGVTSDCEFMKVGFDGEFSETELLIRLNSSMPPGYKVTAARKVEGKEIDITKIDRAVYTVEIECNHAIDVEEFMANNELKVMKKSKSGVKESDIRPYIYELEHLSSDGNVQTYQMCLSVGSSYNLKPDSVIDAMEKYCDGFKAEFFAVHRNKMTWGGKEYI
ncbi:MAG: TIGR03936 family radical SAM-associated protein [Clostridia bacterium]